jgi:hypothetical protein
MKDTIEQLSAQREALIVQLQSIDRLRRGTLSSQIFSKKQGDKTVTQGPYFNLQGFHKGKKFNRHIPAGKAQEVQQHVDNFKRFQELSDQCITLTDQITQLAEGLPASKKNFSSPKCKKKSSMRRGPS